MFDRVLVAGDRLTAGGAAATPDLRVAAGRPGDLGAESMNV